MSKERNIAKKLSEEERRYSRLKEENRKLSGANDRMLAEIKYVRFLLGQAIDEIDG